MFEPRWRIPVYFIFHIDSLVTFLLQIPSFYFSKRVWINYESGVIVMVLFSAIHIYIVLEVHCVLSVPISLSNITAFPFSRQQFTAEFLFLAA